MILNMYTQHFKATCDECYEEIDGDARTMTLFKNHMRNLGWSFIGGDKKKDLCPTCGEEHREFLRGKAGETRSKSGSEG